ncbi:MAG: hypothetical protein HC927_12130 [Deltaproteobacteria bacterium]|nr:hypothetical protein [Deltaproteobacteria bacterium]
MAFWVDSQGRRQAVEQQCAGLRVPGLPIEARSVAGPGVVVEFAGVEERLEHLLVRLLVQPRWCFENHPLAGGQWLLMAIASPLGLLRALVADFVPPSQTLVEGLALSFARQSPTEHQFVMLGCAEGRVEIGIVGFELAADVFEGSVPEAHPLERHVRDLGHA